MRKICAFLSAMLFAGSLYATTFTPLSLISTAGSTAGQTAVSTGPTTAAVWANVSAAALTGIAPVANGGTNCSTASGTCLDNISGFSGTGFLSRTGAGAYSFQTTVGIANGGTGQTTQSASLTAILGSSTIPVANGGTNATTTATARSNLGAAASGVNTDITSLNAPALGAATATTATAGTNTTQVSTTAYTTTAVANQAAITFGTGQTLTNVVGSRVIGTTYTNSTARPIFVYTSFTATTAGMMALQMNSAQFGATSVGLNAYTTFTFVVPPGATYGLSISSGTFTLNTWEELR
jgi:hypothetical protein